MDAKRKASLLFSFLTILTLLTSVINVQAAPAHQSATIAIDGAQEAVWGDPLSILSLYLRGDFNGWGTSDLMNDSGVGGDAVAGDGIYSGQITPSTGRHEFKIATEDWSTSYPSSGNAWFYSTGGPVTVTFDTNTYNDSWLPSTNIIGVDVNPSDWTAVGDWQGWDNAKSETVMALSGGIYQLTVTIPTLGTYQYKAVTTGTWDAIGADGRSVNASTATFTTTIADQKVVLSVNPQTGRIKTEVIVPVWYVRGSFNGWGTSDLMNDSGVEGDTVAGDGIYTAVVLVNALGYHEFRIATADWSTGYPSSGNSWLETTTANQSVTVTFDTNTFTDSWLPGTNIIGVDINPSDWIAVGDWQGWNNADTNTAMTWSETDQAYTLSYSIPAQGTYQYKAVKNGTWDAIGSDGRGVNAGNATFTTIIPNQEVVFSVKPQAGRIKVDVIAPNIPMPNNDIWWDGLGHNSRDTLYRVPQGAVTTGTPVLLRFRTYHNDVTSVTLRLWSTAANAQSLIPMDLVASTDEGDFGYDYWQAQIPAQSQPTVLWYRFIVRDGTDEDFYEDDTLFDGSWGETYDDSPDYSWQIDVYQPDFTTPEWMKNAVIYQIFPDRFFNGKSANDPKPTDPTVYGNSVLFKSWNSLPEGFCRNYQFPALTCNENPLGRDFFGGDLPGVVKKLAYLKSLGVTAIYFNPIFMAPSNHLYDTTDYTKIDSYFGSTGDFTTLAKAADALGMKLILDGVFNHTSSDSLYFDKYSRYPTVGAYESQSSPYSSWYTFTNWPTQYNSWWGFDTLPTLTESIDVKNFIYQGPKNIAQKWITAGASGWRLDVAPDKSHQWWTEFRPQVKAASSDAVIIGEIWDDASDWLLGNQFDSTMNYRFRRALLGFLNGDFSDPNQGSIAGLNPEQFNSALQSIKEDYPKPAFDALMNLVDSHDTQRILWALTPGDRNREDKEFNSSNLAEGKAKVKLLAILQMTMPGAPTVYYGDEVGLTGDTDPDDRRPFPWNNMDLSMFVHYQKLIWMRNSYSFLRTGSFDALYTSNDDGTYAYGRKDVTGAAIVAANRDTSPHDVTIDLQGYIPEGTVLTDKLNGGKVTVTGGSVTLNVKGQWGVILVTPKGVDLTPTAAPAGLQASEGDQQVDLSWSPVSGAAGYNLYRSFVTGGGYVRLNSDLLTSTEYLDESVVNGRMYYFVVTAVDAAGNESVYSNEAAALPHMTIGWANLQWPPTIEHTISAVNRTSNIYGQVWIDGHTVQPGPTEGLRAQVGYGPDGSNPDGNADWTWVDTTFNVDAGNNDEFMGSLLPTAVGTFDYAYRYSTTAGHSWLYADLDGTDNGYSPDQAGSLTVNPSGDTTPPATPMNLRVTEASLSFITFQWDASPDADVYGYEIYRGDASGGPYTLLGIVSGLLEYTDRTVTADQSYYYVLKAVDTSFNRSGYSDELVAVAAARTVTVTFNVDVPSTTPADATVYIAGSFQGWDPGSTPLTMSGDHWTAQFQFQEGSKIEYKYSLGSWTYVEKDASCGEIANRVANVVYGASGYMTLNDTVLNWRNTGTCGD